MRVNLTFRDLNNYELIHVGGYMTDGDFDIYPDSLNSDVKCSVECVVNGYDEEVFNIHFNDLNDTKWMAQLSFVPDAEGGDNHAFKVIVQTETEWELLGFNTLKMDLDDDRSEPGQGQDQEQEQEPEPYMIYMDEHGVFKDCINLPTDDDEHFAGRTPPYGPSDEDSAGPYMSELLY
jgi:hypothetical protein